MPFKFSSVLTCFLLFISLFTYSKNLELTIQSDLPQNFTFEELNVQVASGLYGMSFVRHESKTNTIDKYILVWNFKTGESRGYIHNKNLKKMVAVGKGYTLPDKPLGNNYNLEGEYRMDFIVNGYENPVWTILVWDSKTCFSRWYQAGVNNDSIRCYTEQNQSVIKKHPFGILENVNYEFQLTFNDFSSNELLISVLETNSGKGRVYATQENSLKLNHNFVFNANLPVKGLGVSTISKNGYGCSFAFTSDSKYVLTWNNSTGKSKLFYGNWRTGGYKTPANEYILPSEPLGVGYKVVGKVQMKMISRYVNEVTEWIILVWDTGTGRSQLYYGNTKTKKISAVTNKNYNLPSDPLGNVISNNFYMDLGFNGKDWCILVWDQNKGKSKIYSSYVKEKKWHAFWSQRDGIKVDLPVSNLPNSPME